MLAMAEGSSRLSFSPSSFLRLIRLLLQRSIFNY